MERATKLDATPVAEKQRLGCEHCAVKASIVSCVRVTTKYIKPCIFVFICSDIWGPTELGQLTSQG